MTLFKRESITRRIFFKNVSCTALCCACLPLEIRAATSGTPKHSNEENEKTRMTGTGKVQLAAACGTYCGACPAYIAKHGEDEQNKMNLQKRHSSGPTKTLDGVPPSNWMDGLLCDGCLSGGTLAAHCQHCAIRKCAENKQKDARCSGCDELPCNRITNLINMGHYLHRKEYLPNLKKIREMGVQEWVDYEAERWRCPQCGMPMLWYDAECAGCGKPRSERLFPLPSGL
jgi:hypothetical protein